MRRRRRLGTTRRAPDRRARSEGFMRMQRFDFLWLDGRDLRELPLVERKRRLGA